MATKQNDFLEVRKMMVEASDLLRTTTLPEWRCRRAYELLTAALHLADALLGEHPAAALGATDREKTAKHGFEYSGKTAAKRRRRRDGGPPAKSRPH